LVNTDGFFRRVDDGFEFSVDGHKEAVSSFSFLVSSEVKQNQQQKVLNHKK